MYSKQHILRVVLKKWSIPSLLKHEQICLILSLGIFEECIMSVKKQMQLLFTHTSRKKCNVFWRSDWPSGCDMAVAYMSLCELKLFEHATHLDGNRPEPMRFGRLLKNRVPQISPWGFNLVITSSSKLYRLELLVRMSQFGVGKSAGAWWW